MWCCHGEGGLRHNRVIVLRGRGGLIRETVCSLTVTLPVPVPTALPPTEIQTHPLAEGPACTGPRHHGNHNTHLFHLLLLLLPFHADPQGQDHFCFFSENCEFTLIYLKFQLPFILLHSLLCWKKIFLTSCFEMKHQIRVKILPLAALTAATNNYFTCQPVWFILLIN